MNFKQILIFSLILFCFALVEVTILSNMTFLPTIPDLLLICSLYFSLLNGKGMGETCGFISGLFLDFFSGAPFGLNCLIRTIIGYVAGIFGSSLNFTGFFIPLLIGLLGTLLKVLLTWLTSFFFTSIIVSYDLFSFNFIFELIINVFLTPFLFKFLSLFNRYISTNNIRESF